MKSQSTICVHGKKRKPEEGLNTPIYPSSAYRYRETAENVYPRYYNTINQQEIVDKLCQLEEGETGLLFSSGMAAISTCLFSLLEPGDHAVFSKEIYGGTFSLLSKEFAKRQISYSFATGSEVEDYADVIRPETQLIYLETPSNPLLTIVDIEGVVKLAQEKDIRTMLDNTFASPINQQPLSLGIDLVLHSGTKYLGGHSDLSFGAMITYEELHNLILPQAVNYGGNLNALDCYLIDRSLKTLEIRVERQNENAMKVATFLEQRPEIKSVFYPGLPKHPTYEIARKQMKNFGGMMAFELATDEMVEVDLFLDRLSLIQPSLSLGGVESIICSPAQTSHIKVPREERIKLGISDGLLRLSVGIESPRDIIDDLSQALDKITHLVNQKAYHP